MFFLILRRIASMALIMIVVSLILAVLFEVFKADVVGRILGQYTSDEQRSLWLNNNGIWTGAEIRPGDPDVPYGAAPFENFWGLYFGWWQGLFNGNLGRSLEFGAPVSELLGPRLANTGVLALLTFSIMIPLSLTLGVLAGMREGGPTDRSISVVSVLTTSVPEFAMAAFLIVPLVYLWGWLPGVSSFKDSYFISGDETNFFQDFIRLLSSEDGLKLIMPVAVLVIYDMGYVARMTRASMAEVMQSQYIRTAILKGLPFRTVVWRHALRNALIAPFTVIILQLNWLLSGVVVVEVFFQYRGFGQALYNAALYGDQPMLQACTMVAVFVAVMSQLASDIGYAFLNPRIRYS